MTMIQMEMNIQKCQLMRTILIEFHLTNQVICQFVIQNIMEILILMVIQKLILVTDLLNIMMVQKIFIINPASSIHQMVDLIWINQGETIMVQTNSNLLIIRVQMAQEEMMVYILEVNHREKIYLPEMDMKNREMDNLAVITMTNLEDKIDLITQVVLRDLDQEVQLEVKVLIKIPVNQEIQRTRTKIHIIIM